MPLIANPITSLRRPRRAAAAVIGVAAAAALSVATVSNPWLAHKVGEGISDTLHGVQSVAAMLAERSPRARPDGALVNLKHKKAVLHERALPKIRGPIAPQPTPFEALAGPPPIALPPPAPLFATVAGTPTPIPPVGGGPGGPPVLSDIPLPGGGGGGGGFTPPPITTAEVPPPITPTTPAVPEPASWSIMLLGFALVGFALKRQRLAGLKPAQG
jgi:hypothetical protein